MSKTPMRKKVLFLCTGNSCRSQMAEAIINHTMASQWQAFSAGTKPSGYVHPKAFQILKEMGIYHQGKSKHIDQLSDIKFDLVITVCDSAAKECPLWLGEGKTIHHSFIDPAEATGTEEEVLEVFQHVRDAIAVEIPKVIRDAYDI
jgi:arsenate reductase